MLVALSVVAVSLAAIGSLIATTVRGVRSLEGRVALVETSRAVMTGLPDRDQLAPGNMTGGIAGHRWRVEVPRRRRTTSTGTVQRRGQPYAVVVRVQGAQGMFLQINTVRLRRRVAQ